MLSYDLMFVKPELNLIEKLIKNNCFSETFLQILQQHYVNLEATLLGAKMLRQVAKPHIYYLAQSSMSIVKQQAYLFAPFILANLNKSVIYHCIATTEVLNILKHYHSVEFTASEYTDVISMNTCLEALNLYLHLEHVGWNEIDFFYFSLIQALCRADVAHIFLMTDLTLCQNSLNVLAHFFEIKISWIPSIQDPSILTEKNTLDLNQLLFKQKNAEYIQRCEQFSQLNALLLKQCDAYDLQQSQHLVEDMFYSEHVHERLSVYAEYMQTRRQHRGHFIG